MDHAPTVQARWAHFSSTALPRELADVEHRGIDFATVDSDIAGCISYALAKGQLGPRRQQLLEGRVRLVASLASELPAGSSQEYVARLADLGQCALAAFSA